MRSAREIMEFCKGTFKYLLSLAFCFGIFAGADALLSGKYFSKNGQEGIMQEPEETSKASESVGQAEGSRRIASLNSVSVNASGRSYENVLDLSNQRYDDRPASQNSDANPNEVAPADSFYEATIPTAPALPSMLAEAKQLPPTQSNTTLAAADQTYGSANPLKPAADTTSTPIAGSPALTWDAAIWDTATWGP